MSNINPHVRIKPIHIQDLIPYYIDARKHAEKIVSTVKAEAAKEYEPLLKARRETEDAMLEFLQKSKIGIAIGLPKPDLAKLMYVFTRLYIEMGEEGSRAALHAPQCAAPRCETLLGRMKFHVEKYDIITKKNVVSAEMKIFDDNNNYLGTMIMRANLYRDRGGHIQTNYFELQGDKNIAAILMLIRDTYTAVYGVNSRIRVSDQIIPEFSHEVGKIRSRLL